MKCSIESCPNVVRAKGMCRLHYERVLDGVNVNKSVPIKYDNKLCKYEGCFEKRHAYGYCTMHGSRFKRHGDPSFSERFKWEENAKRYLLYNAKVRAKKFGLPFAITPDDVKIPDICPVLQIPLICSKGKMTDNSPNLDRIEPSKGYVKGNVHVISFLANRIKTNATPEQLMKVALYFNQENK